MCNNDWTGTTCNIKNKETEYSTLSTSTKSEENNEDEKNDLDDSEILPVQEEAKYIDKNVPDSATKNYKFSIIKNFIYFLITIIFFFVLCFNVVA